MTTRTITVEALAAALPHNLVAYGKHVEADELAAFIFAALPAKPAIESDSPVPLSVRDGAKWPVAIASQPGSSLPAEPAGAGLDVERLAEIVEDIWPSAAYPRAVAERIAAAYAATPVGEEG